MENLTRIVYTYSPEPLFDAGDVDGVDVDATVARFSADVRTILTRECPNVEIEIVEDVMAYRIRVTTYPYMEATTLSYDSLAMEIEMMLQDELYGWDGYVFSS